MKAKGSKSVEKSEPGKSGTRPRQRFPIVGIGASAGGLEACTALLKALPLKLGMALVVIPHLDPSRESAFGEILSRTTSMPVLDAKDRTRVLPDHVYVIPPNYEMTINNGVLQLNHSAELRSVRTTIDTFLRSLANDQGPNSVGVILSGTASDGTVGLAAIKGEGGITFAQDSTAKHEGMPESAIAAGCVDLVLPPEGIAKELVRMSQHPYVLGAQLPIEIDGSGRAASLHQIFSLLRRATRVDFSEYKPPTIGRRVARRMTLHKIEQLPDYVRLLQQDRRELDALYQDLLINVTSFFRNADAFESLKRVVYPELLKLRQKSNAPVRIWVPGCSTGEETYSHAITLIEYLAEERIEAAVQIFGTDLSDTAIQRARTGIYKGNIETDLSPVRLRRFFQKVDTGYQISKTIRDLCIFSTQNVFNDPPFSRIDLISCRNVMIYLSQSLQKRVIPVFHYALNPSGYLMIGNTEGLVGPGSELFEIADRKQKIYRKKAVATPMAAAFSIEMSEPYAPLDHEATEAKTVEPARMASDLQRESDRLLLARYAPPSVVVNDQLEIIQTRGHTGPYLELPTGKMSMNVLKMARPGLLFELQNALEETIKSGVEVVRPEVAVEGNGSSKIANLRVSPFQTPVQNKVFFLIAFEPAIATGPLPAEAALSPLSDDERTVKDKQIAQLKQELAATKEYLQSIIEAMESTNEELQSANEEIQSGNEELQSTNEELQTSKEELESANEELHTVNEEMQHRNEQLNQLNNDLNNLLNSVNLPMVMVGPELNIRRFTPQASKLLGLTASDVGRPITRLRLKLVDAGNLEETMLNVIADVRPSHQRLKDGEGRWCELRVTPYRTLDNRIDGVVLSVLTPDETNHGDATASADGPLARKKANHRPKKRVKRR
jgi:two-component system CheB/CheR fusion protein